MSRSGVEISVLLVNGLKMSSDLYAEAFGRRSGFRLVATVGQIDEAIRTVREMTVDIAVISINLNDGSECCGLDALKQIKLACPSVKSIALLDQNEGLMAVSAFRAGAKGVFCTKLGGFDLLCRCIEQVYAGEVWANSAQLHQLLDEFSQHTPAQVVTPAGDRLLTKREEEIVHLVENGLTNREIAKDLGLSEHTVRNNLFRVFDKLGVFNRVELALYAVHNSRSASSQESAGYSRSVSTRRPERPRLPLN
jgi:DNA-binding NarL/FixJ family response regulator